MYQRKNIPLIIPNLQINNENINRERVSKFLGILIDENLSWKNQISAVHTKVSRNLGILYKSRHILPKHLLRQLYFSFIHSHLSYGNIAWASTNKTKLFALHRRQKQSIRAICFKDRTTPSKPLFEELNIMNIYELNFFQILCFTFKCKNGSAPEIFQNIYTLKGSGKYTTRSNQLHTPVIKSNYEKFIVTYRAPHLWNNLPNSISDNNDLSFISFKNEIKKHIKEIDDIFTFF